MKPHLRSREQFVFTSVIAIELPQSLKGKIRPNQDGVIFGKNNAKIFSVNQDPPRTGRRILGRLPKDAQPTNARSNH